MHTIPVSNLCAAAVLGFSAMLSSGPVFARDYAVAVPRVVAPEDARSIYNSVIDLVMTVAGGDTVHVVDATVGETIATFTVPNDGSEVVAANRARAVAEPKAAWGRFVRDHYMADGIDSSSVGAIDLPDTLTALSQAYAHLDPAARTVCALVIGVPLHQDQREPAFDMTPGPLVPSDGLIVAATSMSPYGTADLRGDMQGMRVAFWTLDPPDGWHSDLHEQRVERAWSLYVAARGGVMSAYGPDAATVLQRFEACEAEPVRSFVWDDTRRTPVMLDLRRTMQTQEIEVLIEKEVALDELDIGVGAPVSTIDLGNEDWLRDPHVMLADSPPTVTTAKDVRVGIRWADDGRCTDTDIDLYLSPGANQPFLSYQQQLTSDGFFDKDHLTAPEIANGLEYAVLTESVDLGEIDVRLNLYSGNCEGGPNGVVRAFVDGQVFETAFRIDAETGNGGRNMQDPNDLHWVRIEPKVLFQFD